MGKGFLVIQTAMANEALPVGGARCCISHNGGMEIAEVYSNESGLTEAVGLDAPDKSLTLDKNASELPYSVWDVMVEADGFITIFVHGVQIVDTSTSILNVQMLPLTECVRTKTLELEQPVRQLNVDYIAAAQQKIGAEQITPDLTEEHLVIPESGAILPTDQRQTGINAVREPRPVVIPENIVVHLGVPNNSAARNLTVSFSDYIKNVASSEIFPTWPTNSLISNIHVIVTFTLNRIYTEWYRSRGYPFDITNSTAFDQYFVEGRNIFVNISNIVDEYFNVYARRMHFANPFFTQYCNGTTATCNGLSQWGTVTLANQGKIPLEILRNYYPNDIELVSTDNVQAIFQTYPGYELREGSSGDSVRRMQDYLNRIHVNYPAIPLITNPNGVFLADTTEAVKVFQRVFYLVQDGVIGRQTWNKINFIYVSVTRLAELDSEGHRISVGRTPPTQTLSMGSRGENVLILEYVLNFISAFHDTPTVIQNGLFDEMTANGVREFQKTFNLTVDGIVGPATWDRLFSVYHGIRDNIEIPEVAPTPPSELPSYPGELLRFGSSGDDVRLIQQSLNDIRRVYTSIPLVAVDGIFGRLTQAAVVAFQQQFLLSPDGIVGPLTWYKIMDVRSRL